jgi:hypothetical protein
MEIKDEMDETSSTHWKDENITIFVVKPADKSPLGTHA